MLLLFYTYTRVKSLLANLQVAVPFDAEMINSIGAVKFPSAMTITASDPELSLTA